MTEDAIFEKSRHYDILTLEIMKLACRSESNCVDVGAAFGDILRHIVALAPRGHHFALEPIPGWAERLRKAFPLVSVCEAAASDVNGRDSFVFVVSNPWYSGLRERPYDRSREVLQRIMVDTVRLDDVVPLHMPVDFIKIDVEGGEVLVLRGAEQLLRRCHPIIVFEHGGDSIMRHYGTTSAELWELLVDNLGYSISLMDGWVSGQGRPLSHTQFVEALESEFYFVASVKNAPCAMKP